MMKAISLMSVEPEWSRDTSKGRVTIQFNANGGAFLDSSTTKNLDY
jgi:hypothetical protein